MAAAVETEPEIALAGKPRPEAGHRGRHLGVAAHPPGKGIVVGHPLLAPQMLAEGSVDARLPARPAGAEGIDDVPVEAQGDELLRGLGPRSAAATAKQCFAVMQIGPVEPIVRQLRRSIGIFSDLPCNLFFGGRVTLRQVAVSSGFVLCHWLSSSK